MNEVFEEDAEVSSFWWWRSYCVTLTIEFVVLFTYFLTRSRVVTAFQLPLGLKENQCKPMRVKWRGGWRGWLVLQVGRYSAIINWLYQKCAILLYHAFIFQGSKTWLFCGIIHLFVMGQKPNYFVVSYLFFKGHKHNYFCFCYVQLPYEIFLFQAKQYPLLLLVCIIFLLKDYWFAW